MKLTQNVNYYCIHEELKASITDGTADRPVYELSFSILVSIVNCEYLP